MMKHTLKLIGITAVAVSLITACTTGNAQRNTQTSGETAASEPQRVVVGIGNDYYPVCYVDESGNVQGYDYEILKLVDEMLPQYEFEYVPTETKNILVGLETGTYDIGAHALSWSQERAEKYLIADQPYGTHNYRIIAQSGRTDLQTFKDLEGKVIISKTGSAETTFIEEYNRTHAEVPIEIVYGEVLEEFVVKGILDGRYDARIAPTRYFVNCEAAFPGALECVGKENILPGYYYHYFSQGNEQLREDVGAAVAQLNADGVLQNLSLEILGDDYTVNEYVADPNLVEY